MLIYSAIFVKTEKKLIQLEVLVGNYQTIEVLLLKLQGVNLTMQSDLRCFFIILNNIIMHRMILTIASRLAVFVR